MYSRLYSTIRLIQVLHCIALHCIALHCIALHCIALHCIALYCIALHCIVLYIIIKEDKPRATIDWCLIRRYDDAHIWVRRRITRLCSRISLASIRPQRAASRVLSFRPKRTTSCLPTMSLLLASTAGASRTRSRLHLRRTSSISTTIKNNQRLSYIV